MFANRDKAKIINNDIKYIENKIKLGLHIDKSSIYIAVKANLYDMTKLLLSSKKIRNRDTLNLAILHAYLSNNYNICLLLFTIDDVQEDLKKKNNLIYSKIKNFEKLNNF